MNRFNQLTAVNSFARLVAAALRLLTVGCGLCLFPVSASAGLYYYSGDMNNTDALGNVSNGAYTLANTYNSFTVTGSPITVTGLFTNNIMDYPDSGPLTADWSIRSGVSNGNGGTVIDSGTSVAATQTATGNTLFGLNEYTVGVSGLSVALAPGNYWFNVTPDGLGGGNGFSAQTTTNGTTNPFFSSVDSALVFTPATTQGAQFANLSGGVFATSISTPEPQSLLLMVSGIGGLFVALRHRRRAASRGC